MARGKDFHEGLFYHCAFPELVYGLRLKLGPLLLPPKVGVV